jgi:hypothetical protein
VTADPELKPAPPRPDQPWRLWLDRAARVLGLLIALLLAAVSAAFEVFYTPLYLGSSRFPVSLLAAVVGNVGLVYFTYLVTGRRIAAVGPALVWVAVMVVAASRTSEGDLVLTDNNWVGIGTMLAGSVALAGAGYRLMLTAALPRRPADTPDGGVSPDAKPLLSGSDPVE